VSTHKETFPVSPIIIGISISVDYTYLLEAFLGVVWKMREKE
jgi:hypothetical protein